MPVGLALALAVTLASPEPCHLVTNDRIDEIPCDLEAAEIDALRYAAEDAPEARAKRAEQQRRDPRAWQYAPRTFSPRGRPKLVTPR